MPPPAKKANGLVASFVDLFPVAFEVVGDAFKPGDPGSGGTRIEESLNLEQNWQAVEGIVKKMLAEQSSQLLRDPSGFSASSKQRAAKALKSLGGAAGRKLEQDLRTTPAFRRLESEGNQLKEQWKSAPTGLLFDTEKGRIIIVGAVVVVGGTIGMYRLGKGTLVESELSDALGSYLKKKARIPIGGTFEANVSGIEIKPSTGEYAVSAEAVKSFESLTLKSDVTIKHVVGKGTSASVGSETVVDLGAVTVIGRMGVRGSDDYNLGLHVQPKSDGVQLDLSVTHSVTPQPMGPTPIQETKVGVSLKFSF